MRIGRESPIINLIKAKKKRKRSYMAREWIKKTVTIKFIYLIHEGKTKRDLSIFSIN